jgi:hypothetical protein
MCAQIALLDRSEIAQELNRIAVEVRAQHRGLLRELRIELTEGGVTLRGRATTYYGKQLAFHEVMRRCSLVVVANRIEVIAGPATV